VSTSLWQTPQACTLMRTCPGTRVRNLALNDLEICSGFRNLCGPHWRRLRCTATLIVAINPPTNFVTSGC